MPPHQRTPRRTQFRNLKHESVVTCKLSFVANWHCFFEEKLFRFNMLLSIVVSPWLISISCDVIRSFVDIVTFAYWRKRSSKYGTATVGEKIPVNISAQLDDILFYLLYYFHSFVSLFQSHFISVFSSSSFWYCIC